MRIANTISDSIVDGPGLRFTVFTQGCPHACPGCHNPETHDPSGGYEESVEVLCQKMAGNPLTEGLTLSGGDPFLQAGECALLARGAHERGLNVWVYTGYTYEKLMEDIELLDVAGDEFDIDKILQGQLTPMFFGSATNNFGVEPFLKEFLRLTPTPLPYTDCLTGDPVDPMRDEFSGFVFKIQANMDKNHRDRIAFVRICSGKFERGMDAMHMQGGKKLKLATGTSLMADDRATVDEAYAGDIVGLFDPGIFSIGDTVCAGKCRVQYPEIPTFAPEIFARVTQVNTLKRKQFVKGMEELAQEGAIQIFREPGFGMESVIVGVVGVLQLDVLEQRLKSEYGVEVRRQALPYSEIRWIMNDPSTYDIAKLNLTSDTLRVEDMRGRKLLLFTSAWNVNWASERNADLELSEVGNFSI